MLTIRLTARGGFRHVQHVRPNRGTHKKGAPTGQRLSDASFRMQKAMSPLSTLNSDNSSNIAYSSHRMFLYINVRKFMWGRAPRIFTEQGLIGFKSGPAHSNLFTSMAWLCTIISITERQLTVKTVVRCAVQKRDVIQLTIQQICTSVSSTGPWSQFLYETTST